MIHVIWYNHENEALSINDNLDVSKAEKFVSTLLNGGVSSTNVKVISGGTEMQVDFEERIHAKIVETKTEEN